MVKQGIKRTMMIALAVAIYIFLMMCTVKGVTPSGDFSMEQLVRDDMGNIYVAGFAGNEALVCRLDENGNMEGYYRCGRETRSADLLCEYYDGRIYICQVWHEVTDDGAPVRQRFGIWRSEGNGVQCIWQGTTESDTDFTDMRVDEEGIFLTGIDRQTKEVLICWFQNEKLQILRYDADCAPLKVCLGKKGLYLCILADDDQMYLARLEGDKWTKSDVGEASAVITDKRGIYWQEVGSSDINYLLYDSIELYVLWDIGDMQDITYSDHAPEFAALLRESEGNRLLTVNQDGTDGQYITVDVTRQTPEILAENALIPMLMVTLAYVAVWAVFLLMIRFLQDKSRLLCHAASSVIKLSGVGLIVIMVLLHFQGGESYSGMILVIAAILEWLAAVIITLLFLGHIWRNTDILVAWMDKVSRGEYNIENRKAPDDEFGKMWTALERMCKSLQMQKYRHVEVTDYLYQYAPKNFELLFDKTDLHDIEIGETRQLPVTLGMISIIDKKTFLTGKIQKQYMQYINGLMDLLYSQRDSRQAVFLQGDNMENVKVVFKGGDESASSAVRYSIECMEALLRRTEGRYHTTPFILLHTATVSCGLAGSSRQVYPYVTSLEVETLARFGSRLRSSGIRIAVTESTWQQVREQAQGRYIGYVASPDQKYLFRLYEILDACPQSQKLGRIRNRQRFEQALELFYNNDLYLAKSAFAEVLKECPDDGIAEWYIFACDKLFNEGDGADNSHELFGREEIR